MKEILFGSARNIRQGTPCTKIIFHQIAYKLNGEKVLLCSAILCNLNGAAVLEIADNLSNQKHKDIEELRSKLFLTDEEKLVSLWEKLSEFQNLKLSFPSKPEIKYFAGKIRSGDNPSAVVQEMARTGIIGEHSISCAAAQISTFSELIANRTITPKAEIHAANAEQQWESLAVGAKNAGKNTVARI